MMWNFILLEQGPMQETLPSGGSVISTKLEWAIDEFDEIVLKFFGWIIMI